MKLSRLAALALVAALTVHAMAQTGPTATDMQILAQKVNADKKLLVAANMQLTDAEAKGFWPIYDSYQKDLEVMTVRVDLGYLDLVSLSSRLVLTSALSVLPVSFPHESANG